MDFWNPIGEIMNDFEEVLEDRYESSEEKTDEENQLKKIVDRILESLNGKNDEEIRTFIKEHSVLQGLFQKD